MANYDASLFKQKCFSEICENSIECATRKRILIQYELAINITVHHMPIDGISIDIL